MKLSPVPYRDGIRKRQQIQFGGYNHNLGAGDGELWDMTNLTSDLYPLLAPRGKRYTVRTLTTPNGLYHADALYTVDGNKLYKDGAEVGTLTGSGRRTMVALGKRLLIWPDKMIYDGTSLSSLEASVTGTSCTIQDGTYAGETAEANTIYAASVTWSDYFKAGDAVAITGATTHAENNKTPIIREIDGHYLRFYENTFTINEGGDSETLTLKREAPDLDFLCVNENRVWGCKGDTIRCSKLGDPFNWNVFDGISTDAWSVESGTGGDFTACASFLGYPVFFKEDKIFKVYGNKPTNFELMSSATLGVAAGSDRSLAVANETLYYLARTGIIAYTGGIPQSISAAFGTVQYSSAVGGSDGSKYYVSMQDASGYHLFVYDTQRGMWHREDDTQALGMAYDEGLYCLRADGKLILLGTPQTVPAGATAETSVSSMAEFGDFTNGEPNKKGASKLHIRLELDAGATVTVKMKFDSGNTWQTVTTLTGPQGVLKRSYYLPIIPRRSDHYRIRFDASGGWRLHSVAREDYIGSEQ